MLWVREIQKAVDQLPLIWPCQIITKQLVFWDVICVAHHELTKLRFGLTRPILAV